MKNLDPSASSTKPLRGAKPPRLAMHSAANPDWGSPMLLRRFAQVVLAHTSRSEHSIDLDYSTSAYWQTWWPEGDAPCTYLDGSKGKDVLLEADRDVVCRPESRGSGFLNPAGLNGGSMVQKSWSLFEQDHRNKKLGSGVWVGFSLEQFPSLQGIAPRNPLTVGIDDLITTIVPSRRCRYLLHPEQYLAVLRKKQASRDRRSKLWQAEERKALQLLSRSSDAPVPGNAPSHSSYISILWSAQREKRRRQKAEARLFLKAQQAVTGSLFEKFEVVGSLDMEN